MRFQRFRSTWQDLHASNRVLKTVAITQSAALVLAVLALAGQGETLVLVPPRLDEPAKVAAHQGDAAFKKAWGYFAASLVGNITPKNADFVLSTLEKMTSGEARTFILERVAQDLELLKQEQVTMTFEVTQVLYEPETDKVFVSGRASVSQPGAKPAPTEETFEMKIDVRQYAPLIVHFAVYPGIPKTQDVVKREVAQSAAPPR